MLQPKKQKYRKQFRGKMRGNAQVGNKLEYGEYGLKALTRGWVSARQIEAARKAISHFTKRAGRTYIRIFPDKPVTSKPNEVKMGGGKGDITGYAAVVKPGRVLFELGGVEEEVANQALKRAAFKLSVRTRLVKKDS